MNSDPTEKSSAFPELVRTGTKLPKRLVDAIISIVGVGLSGDEDVFKSNRLKEWLER